MKLAMVLLICGATVWAQTVNPSHDSLAREQESAAAQVERLVKKAEELAVRLKTEGRTHAAELLTKAAAEARAKSIRSTMEQAGKFLSEGHLFEAQAHHQRRERLDGGDANFVAAPEGERQTMAFQAVDIGLEHADCGGIVRIGIHGVRAVEAERSGKTDVEGLDPRDAQCHVPGS